MVVSQVSGVFESFLSNRQNEVSLIIGASSLPPEQKHSLHVINRSKAWLKPDFKFKDKSLPDTPEIRSLARRIFKQVLKRHSLPNLSRVHLLLDVRMATFSSRGEDKRKVGGFNHWIRCSTLEKGNRINLPLAGNLCFEKREGRVANSVQLIRRENGWFAGISKDVSETYEKSKASYLPLVDELSLDLGLSVFLATDQGDLLGRNWLETLTKHDRAIAKLASERQKRGLKVRCPRYDRLVEKVRGFIKSNVCRILNRLVETRMPKKLILERLDFQNPSLSKRLNRIMGNFGKGVLTAKLADLEARYGIETEYRNPAYTSQECPSCHFIAKGNRSSRDKFSCLWCGKQAHADVVGARNTKGGRSPLARTSGRLSVRLLRETLGSQATMFRPWRLSGASIRGRASPGTLWESSAYKANGISLPRAIELHCAMRYGIRFPTSDCKWPN